MQKKPTLAGRVAVVSGGGGGIQKACIEALKSAGCAVIALCTSSCELKISDDILCIICDTANLAQIKKAIESGVKKFGGIDIVLFCDGTTNEKEELLLGVAPYLEFGIDPTVIEIQKGGEDESLPAINKAQDSIRRCKIEYVDKNSVSSQDIANISVLMLSSLDSKEVYIRLR